MGKQLLIIAFVLVFGASLYVFFNRDKAASKLGSSAKEQVPRIALEDFVLYKYKDNRVVSSAGGKLASFYDPSTLEVLGDVKISEEQNNKNREVSSESLTVHFLAKGLSELATDNRVDFAEIENQVRFQYDGVTVFTDHAKYKDQEQKLSSDLPVRIQGPNLDVMGSRGFEFLGKNNDLKVYGPLEGTLNSINP